MRTLIFSLLVVTAPPFGDGPPTTSAEIRATAQPASAELAPLSADDRSIRLPELEFSLRIEPACTGGAEPRSLSISIADTRRHFAASDLDGRPMLEATVTLPEGQLGPVRIDNFCHAGKDDGPSSLLLEDAFTARLSLRCSLEENQTIVYATLPLDVALLCRRVDTAVPAPAQDPASDGLSESF